MDRTKLLELLFKYRHLSIAYGCTLGKEDEDEDAAEEHMDAAEREFIAALDSYIGCRQQVIGG